MQKRRRRRGFTIGLLSLGLLAGVALTAGPAQAVSSNGPYYAEPAWDQKLDAATRFVVLTNWNSEAVLDRETGLVWEKAVSSGGVTWRSALFSCANRAVGDRKGWRLPSVVELSSLVAPSVPGPTLPPGHPFSNVLPVLYWTATADAGFPTTAWFVRFDDGRVGINSKTSTFAVWCVRGAMNADAY